MAPSGDRIHELPEKITAMCRILGEESSTKQLTRDALAEHCGIKPNTLKECLKVVNRRMSSDLQRQLTDKVGFSADDPAWLDRHADGMGERRDSAAHFEAMLRRRRSMSGPLCFEASRAKLLRRDLASFEVTDSPQERAPDIRVFFEGYFRSGVDGKVRYGFSRVLLAFELDEEGTSYAADRLGYPDVISLGRAKLICNGPPHHPQWFLETDDGPLEGPHLTRDDPLFVLKGGVPEQEVKARLSVQLRDGDVFAEKNGVSVSNRTMETVLSRLREMRMCSGDPPPDGWLELGMQQIKIVASRS